MHPGDKAKSNPQIHHLERTVPSASTVTSLVNSGSSRPSRNPEDEEPIPLCATCSAPVGIFPEGRLRWPPSC
jgi:hypothetical protein